MLKFILIFDLVLVGLIVVLKIVQKVVAARRLKKRFNELLKGKVDIDATDVSNVSK